MAYRVLLVEDDKQAQENIVGLIHRERDLQLVGVASTIEAAAELSNSMNPDLVICDVILPPATSFDWLNKLESFPFELVFTTSYEEFAVRAFRLAAIDYLMKPVDPVEFRNAIERYRSKQRVDSRKIKNLLSNLSMPKSKSKIALPTFTGYLFVDISEIIRCESDNSYTTFFLEGGEQILVSRNLKDVEQMLDEFDFFRVHNSYLINLNHIKEYFKGEGGQVKMVDGSIVDVSRRRKDSFLKVWR